MFAIGSIIRNLKFKITDYQDDFLTPGTSPLFANSLKQIRQRPNCRKKPRLRPQRKQRRTKRLENFGFFSALAIWESLAIALKKFFYLKNHQTPQIHFLFFFPRR